MTRDDALGFRFADVRGIPGAGLNVREARGVVAVEIGRVPEAHDDLHEFGAVQLGCGTDGSAGVSLKNSGVGQRADGDCRRAVAGSVGIRQIGLIVVSREGGGGHRAGTEGRCNFQRGSHRTWYGKVHSSMTVFQHASYKLNDFLSRFEPDNGTMALFSCRRSRGAQESLYFI